MNYFAVIVVDVYDKVIEINTTLGRPDGVKSDMVCPENGYLIGLKGAKDDYNAIISKIQVGDSIELINVERNNAGRRLWRWQNNCASF